MGIAENGRKKPAPRVGFMTRGKRMPEDKEVWPRAYPWPHGIRQKISGVRRENAHLPRMMEHRGKPPHVDRDMAAVENVLIVAGHKDRRLNRLSVSVLKLPRRSVVTIAGFLRGSHRGCAPTPLKPPEAILVLDNFKGDLSKPEARPGRHTPCCARCFWRDTWRYRPYLLSSVKKRHSARQAIQA